MFPTDPFSLIDNICYPNSFPVNSYPVAPWGSPSADMSMPQLPLAPLLAPPPTASEPIPVPEPQPQAKSDPERGAAAHPAGEAPPPAPAPQQQDYPALIVLKPGGMYSATSYWVKNKNLYFATTQGEVLYTPLAQVERLYPATKARQ